LNMKG